MIPIAIVKPGYKPNGLAFDYNPGVAIPIILTVPRGYYGTPMSKFFTWQKTELRKPRIWGPLHP
jgi:hypothetical protein